ncbi:hypothetical protein GCM10020219_094240 [Nonomuraea dietziae]
MRVELDALTEGRHRPPRQAERVGLVADLLKRAEGGRVEVDRRLAPRRRVDPRRLEELLAGPDQLLRPAPDALGVADEHRRVPRQVVDQQVHLARQHGRERLHALDRHALGQLVEHLGQRGVLVRQRGRLLPHVGGQQQLAARRREQAVVGHLERALVGHLEPADLLDRVAPELQAQRVLLRRGEHVEQAAAHGDLAALLHHVDPGVAVLDQPVDHVVQVGVVARAQPDRLEVAETLDDRLQHRANRRDDH